MTGKSTLSVFLLLAILFSSAQACADQQSAHYRMEADLVTGGGAGFVTGTDYRIEESTIDWVTKTALSSANYSLENKAGINDVELIPVISSVDPGNYSRFFTDDYAFFTVNVLSPDDDPLQYQAKQDEILKFGPENYNQPWWALGDSDKGRHALEISVIEQHGTVTQEQAMYVYRRPVK